VAYPDLEPRRRGGGRGGGGESFFLLALQAILPPFFTQNKGGYLCAKWKLLFIYTKI